MNKNSMPEGLFEESMFTQIRDKVSYFTKSIDSYQCHIFSIQLSSIKELKNYWEAISATIATNFQSQLETDIEIWNVYIVFIVDDIINKEIKYKIEQDKYSARKIVFDYKDFKRAINDYSKLSAIIEDKLFGLKSKPYADSNYDTSENIIKKLDINLYNSLLDYSVGNRIDNFYNLYIRLQDGK